ncbi:MAG: PilZ domain-containing protein [Magnetococcales bacterium]|nr:PilZ domain-containing protein [Magnetococcales bacterium]
MTTTSSSMQDKKRGSRAKRVKALYPVQLEVGDTSKFVGKITDISEFGLYMTIKHKLAKVNVGDEGRLSLLPKAPGLYKEVRVMRVESDGLGLQSI